MGREDEVSRLAGGGEIPHALNQALADFGLDPKLAPPVMKEMIK